MAIQCPIDGYDLCQRNRQRFHRRRRRRRRENDRFRQRFRDGARCRESVPGKRYRNTHRRGQAPGMTISSEHDVAALKSIGRIVATVLRDMTRAVEPGMTTAELDALGGRLLEQQGARSAPRLVYDFPGDTCISINEEAAHGVPGQRGYRTRRCRQYRRLGGAGRLFRGYRRNAGRTTGKRREAPAVSCDAAGPRRCAGHGARRRSYQRHWPVQSRARRNLTVFASYATSPVTASAGSFTNSRKGS